jgi:hypothetical protein
MAGKFSLQIKLLANVMKRIYEFITKANQVLLFLVIIGGTATISYLVYESFSDHYEPPHVSVAQTPEETKKTVVEDVRFLGQSSGFYMFGIVKRVVTPTEEVRRKTPKLALVCSLSGDGGYVGEIVNVVFSKGEQRVKELLQNDGLVLSHYVSGNYRSEKIKPLLFLCVTEDTDGNHVLDKNDRNDLYVISDGLDKPDLVIKGVLDFDVISPTHLMVKTGEQNALQFWDIDTETQAKKEVSWK